MELSLLFNQLKGVNLQSSNNIKKYSLYRLHHVLA
jgi:hypothetical protein